MPPADRGAAPVPPDVLLVLEATYPYVRGGVSSWIHDLIGNLPELRFRVVHVGPERGAYPRPLYDLPPNVAGVTDLYCREPLERGADRAALERTAHAARRRHARRRRPSRLLRGLRRLHLEDAADHSLLEDLASADLPVEAFLHGRESFELTEELYETLAPDASFVAFFWHLRSMHLPLVRLLATPPPPAGLYHALCTGYAGLLAAAWSLRAGRPLLLTEHGLYTRERRLELDRAHWLTSGRQGAGRTPGSIDELTSAPLRQMWSRFFRMLAGCAYTQAATIVSLCETSRARQVADGAVAERTRVIPNGIDLPAFLARCATAAPAARRSARVRVGFVGRLVHIKDLVTFLRACALAKSQVALDVRIIGPTEEDPRYVRRCRRLAEALGVEDVVHFERERPLERIYPELDLLVLTSFSEGQPLVILEAGAAGLPVVASDVGACRELLQGRGGDDRRLGPSGIVTRLSAPDETAAAIVRLARDPMLRHILGAAGRRRVERFYREEITVSLYRTLYEGSSWRESAGVSNDGGIRGAAMAYATGAAVMALPWVLTTAVLLTCSATVGRGVAGFDAARIVVNVAFAVALLVSGPIQIVVSRHTADRVFEGRLRAIAAPLCRGLATAFPLCAAFAAVALGALHLPLRAVLCGAALAAAVGAQWTVLSAGNGLCSPGFVLGAVGIGSIASLVLATLLITVAGLGAPGYLLGLILGQTVTLVVLLVGILRALPPRADEGARLWPAFRSYASLAAAGFAFNGSLWIDKLVVWWQAGLQAAVPHSEASTIAWFSTIPCLAWIFVEVETRFHRRFRWFYRDLEGGATLAELRHGVRTLKAEAARLLAGAAGVQAATTILAQLAADPWMSRLGLPPDALLPLRFLLLGAGAQAVSLLGLILLYYFDLRREAFVSAAGLFAAVGAGTLAAMGTGLPPSLGTAVGGGLGSVFVWMRLLRSLGDVLPHTLLGQPYRLGSRRVRRRSGRRGRRARIRTVASAAPE